MMCEMIPTGLIDETVYDRQTPVMGIFESLYRGSEKVLIPDEHLIAILLRRMQATLL